MDTLTAQKQQDKTKVFVSPLKTKRLLWTLSYSSLLHQPVKKTKKWLDDGYQRKALQYKHCQLIPGPQ